MQILDIVFRNCIWLLCHGTESRWRRVWWPWGSPPRGSFRLYYTFSGNVKSLSFPIHFTDTHTHTHNLLPYPYSYYWFLCAAWMDSSLQLGALLIGFYHHAFLFHLSVSKLQWLRLSEAPIAPTLYLNRGTEILFLSSCIGLSVQIMKHWVYRTRIAFGSK